MTTGLLGAIASATLAFATTTSPASPQEKAVRAVVARLYETWNAHDMAAFASLFAEDADFVNVIGLRWHGRPEIEAQHAALHAGRMRGTRLSEVDTRIRLLTPEVALAQSAWELRGDAGAPGWKVGDVRRGVFTHVLVRRSDGWQIVSSQNTDIVDVPNQ